MRTVSRSAGDLPLMARSISCEAIHLPLGCVHRMVNPGKIPLEIVEVQIGSYTGEDDIVRIEDVYGR